MSAPPQGSGLLREARKEFQLLLPHASAGQLSAYGKPWVGEHSLRSQGQLELAQGSRACREGVAVWFSGSWTPRRRRWELQKT